MKRFNRGDRAGVLHFITINTRGKAKAFLQDVFARMVLYKLREFCDRHPAKLIAYVVMPDHMHCIINPRDGRVLFFLSQFKPATTLAALDIAIDTGPQRVINWLHDTSNGVPQLWQDGKHSLELIATG